MEIAVFLFTIGALLSSFSQILLKISAGEKKTSRIKEILNWKVICAYSIYLAVTVINTIAFRYTSFKLGPVLGASTYVFLLLMAHFLLGEEINRNKIRGALLIVTGIVIFSI